jgi:malate/lactate dehydrogenase
MRTAPFAGPSHPHRSAFLWDQVACKHEVAAVCRIIASIVDGMKPFGSRTVLLLVSNPVDVLTAVAQRASGLPTERVIGSGAPLQPQ